MFVSTWVTIAVFCRYPCYEGRGRTLETHFERRTNFRPSRRTPRRRARRGYLWQEPRKPDLLLGSRVLREVAPQEIDSLRLGGGETKKRVKGKEGNGGEGKNQHTNKEPLNESGRRSERKRKMPAVSQPPTTKHRPDCDVAEAPISRPASSIKTGHASKAGRHKSRARFSGDVAQRAAPVSAKPRGFFWRPVT